MNLWYPHVALRAAHRCEYCHAPEAIFNFPFEVDHILPVVQGGADVDANLALACRSCNLRKAAHTRGFDPESLVEVRLFDPRQDNWERHFRPDSLTGEIRGLTEIGRATVARLEMNGQLQVAARHQWMRLGLFP
jgi:hypothetical protein